MRNKSTCDLCGLPVGAVAYTLRINGQQTKQFCCDGCKGIYQMLHEDQVVDEDGAPRPD